MGKRNSFFQSNSPKAKAKRTLDNIEFHSITEKEWYRCYLKPLVQLGKIRDLEFQPVFQIIINGFTLGIYTADFKFKDEKGESVIHEVKGARENREFSIKWKIVQILYPENKYALIKAKSEKGKLSFREVKRIPKKTP